MNVKTTLLLLVVLVAVIAAMLITRGHEFIAPSQDSRPGSALFTADQFPAESIDRISLQFADGTRLQAEKRDGEWWQSEPVHFPLNQWSVRQMLDSLAGLRSLESFQPGQDGNPTLEDTGLAPPRVTVQLRGTRDAKDVQQLVRLGRCVSNRTYLQVGDRLPVFVVSGALTDSVSRSAVLQWRRTTLPAPSAGSTQRVILDTPRQNIEISRSDGRWQIQRPLPARADAQVVDALAAAISRLTIKQFVADAPPDLSVFGLTSPTAVLTVFSAPPAPPPAATTSPASPQAASLPSTQPTTEPAPAPQLRQTLTVGAPADMQGDTYFATWSDSREPGNVVFTIPQQDVARLQVSLDSLRDPRITPVAASDVKELRIDRPGAASLTLHRTPDGWDFGITDMGYLPDKALADQLVTAITSARATSYQLQAPAGPPTAILTLQTITGSPAEVLRLWQLLPAQAAPEAAPPAEGPGVPAPTGSNWLVLRQQEEVVYVVPAENLLGILQPAMALRQRLVLDVQPSQITALTLTQSDGTTYELNRVRPATQSSASQPASAPAVAPGTWLLSDNAKLNHNALNQLLSALCPLRAVRWLEGPPPQGNVIRLSLRTDDGRDFLLILEPASHRAVFGPPGSPSTPFEIPAALAQAAQAELRDTTVLAIGIEDIASVTVTDPGQPSTTLRRDSQGQYLSSASGELDARAVDNLFRALANLSVAHYLDRTPAPTPPAGRTVELALVSGRTLKIVLPALPGTSSPDAPPSSPLADEHPPVLLDGRWVQLDPQTFSKLSAPLTTPARP